MFKSERKFPKEAEHSQKLNSHIFTTRAQTVGTVSGTKSQFFILIVYTSMEVDGEYILITSRKKIDHRILRTFQKDFYGNSVKVTVLAKGGRTPAAQVAEKR